MIVLGLALIVVLMFWTHRWRLRLEREDALAVELADALAEAFGVESDEAQAVVELARNGHT